MSHTFHLKKNILYKRKRALILAILSGMFIFWGIGLLDDYYYIFFYMDPVNYSNQVHCQQCNDSLIEYGITSSDRPMGNVEKQNNIFQRTENIYFWVSPNGRSSEMKFWFLFEFTFQATTQIYNVTLDFDEYFGLYKGVINVGKYGDGFEYSFSIVYQYNHSIPVTLATMRIQSPPNYTVHYIFEFILLTSILIGIPILIVILYYHQKLKDNALLEMVEHRKISSVPPASNQKYSEILNDHQNVLQKLELIKTHRDVIKQINEDPDTMETESSHGTSLR